MILTEKGLIFEIDEGDDSFISKNITFSPSNCVLNSKVQMKGFFIQKEVIFIVCLNEFGFIQLFSCNIIEVTCTNGYNINFPNFRNGYNVRDIFSFFKLSEEEVVLAFPTTEGTAFFYDIFLEIDNYGTIISSLTIESKDESRDIKSVSCEKFKEESEILCLYRIYIKENNFLKIQHINFKANTTNDIIDISKDIDKDGKLNLEEIKYSKLIKIFENNFVLILLGQLLISFI